MRLIVTGGGTGGHLFPGIALATAMQRRVTEARVLFIGTQRLMDQKALAGRNFELAALDCGAIKGLGLVAKLKSLLRMPGAVAEARTILKRFEPDLVFGVGGYVTGPVLVAARLLRVPIVIHEQNSVPGLANRLAGMLADRICISLPCRPPFPAARTVLTGNPVRQEILEAGAREKKEQAMSTVLVLGGSQGAHRVNLLMMEAVERLTADGQRLRIIHQTGAADEEIVRTHYSRLGVDAEVAAFVADMAGAYARADLAVSRAGATTLAELAVMGLPALLIPFPYAADNHQVTNGEYYTKSGACRMIEEAVLSGEILARSISEGLHNKEELHTMAAKMKALAQPDAAERIVDECLHLFAGGRQHG